MKSIRQQAILELIKNRICLTQEDLQNGLLEAGFKVTQSTVSRDINQLNLVKGRDKDGNYRYLADETHNVHTAGGYAEIFNRAVKNIDYALNNVVINCYNGMASGACVAVDELFGDMMLGSLAGEDAIIIVTRSEADSENLVRKLKNLK